MGQTGPLPVCRFNSRRLESRCYHGIAHTQFDQPRAMRRVIKVVLFVAVISPMPVGVAQQPSSPADGGDQGKNIFVSRCAKCHDADASRKLPDGTDLLGRLARSPDPKTLLATRLKDQRERDAVMVYLRPLIRSSRAAGPGSHAAVTPADPKRPR